jgi:hypothetical protein
MKSDTFYEINIILFLQFNSQSNHIVFIHKNSLLGSPKISIIINYLFLHLHNYFRFNIQNLTFTSITVFVMYIVLLLPRIVRTIFCLNFSQYKKNTKTLLVVQEKKTTTTKRSRAWSHNAINQF